MSGDTYIFDQVYNRHCVRIRKRHGEAVVPPDLPWLQSLHRPTDEPKSERQGFTEDRGDLRLDTAFYFTMMRIQ